MAAGDPIDQLEKFLDSAKHKKTVACSVLWIVPHSEDVAALNATDETIQALAKSVGGHAKFARLVDGDFVVRRLRGAYKVVASDVGFIRFAVIKQGYVREVLSDVDVEASAREEMQAKVDKLNLELNARIGDKPIMPSDTTGLRFVIALFELLAADGEDAVLHGRDALGPGELALHIAWLKELLDLREDAELGVAVMSDEKPFTVADVEAAVVELEKHN